MILALLCALGSGYSFRIDLKGNPLMKQDVSPVVFLDPLGSFRVASPSKEGTSKAFFL
jgi:hypothetical protein